MIRSLARNLPAPGLSLLGAALLAGASPAALGAAPPAWEAGTGFRSHPAPPAGAGRTGFTRLEPAASGITFTNHLAEQTGANNRVFENGSGVALGDVDGDGWCDVYLCRLEGDNVLYRNLGNWRFEDVTAAAGVGCPGQYSTGATLADVDGDADLDLLVNGIGAGTRLFLNDGQGKFTEQREGRLVRRFGATSMALADMDGDGDLDLYVTNYRTDTFRDDPPGLRVEAIRQADGSITVKPEGRFVPLMPRDGGLEVIERGERDFLYLNQGGGNFAPVSWTQGAFVDEDGNPLKEPTTDWGLSVLFRDLNGDGFPDLYVCNDFVYWPDRIWLSEEGRRFRAAPRTAFRNQSLSSMAVDAADLNRDGFDDLFVADMLTRHLPWRAWQRPNTLEGLVVWPKGDPQFRPEVTRNTLHLARGDGTFAEIACLANLAATEWTWAVAFLDVDLDGWEDLLVANGNAHDVQHADVLAAQSRLREARTPENRLKNVRQFPPLVTANLAFRNERDLTFRDRSADWGFAEKAVSTGLALGDLDNDGDPDVVLNNLNGPASLYRNDSPAPRLGVRLRGSGANSRGIGARIRVIGGPVAQTQEMIAGGRYCSGDEAFRSFAAGEGKGPWPIEVTWRSGKVTRIEATQANRVYEVSEDAAPAGTRPAPPVPSPRFQRVTLGGPLVHGHEPVDDFTRQPLLPRRLSPEGPGLSWIDLDGDGREELLLPGGRANPLRWLARDATGNFQPAPGSVPALPDQAEGVICLPWSTDRTPSALVIAAGRPDASGPGPAGQVMTASGNAPGPSALPALPTWTGSAGTLAAADLDRDGTLELFVGNRFLPGRWPEAGPSLVLRSGAQGWETWQTLTNAGLVGSAVFTDWDQDGDADLVVAAEWSPLRLYRNESGRLVEWTDAPGISDRPGWWTSVRAGDFDGDGRPDLVAGNWGRNFRPDPQVPGDRGMVVHWESPGDGLPVVPVVGHWDGPAADFLPWRERKAVTAALPAVAVKYPDHVSYGNARVREFPWENPERVHNRAASWFASTVFLNRGDRFEARELPVEAQFAPVFGLAVADFDGDSREDVALTQNFFATDAETSRQDAGATLILAGQGDGTFRVWSAAESGLRLEGEGRGLAVADFDRDGRADLATAQYRGPVELWRNTFARPGRRVTLEGPPGNPRAAGASFRVRDERGWGPRRENPLGGGWRSVDSATHVIGLAGTPREIEVRWPDGTRESLPWPGDAPEVWVTRAKIRPTR